jgi:hypothetical protein
MAEKMHISEMLDISDEDAAEVLKDIAVSVAAHHLMSEVLGELAAKYDKKAILAGMMMTKTFDLNERVTSEREGEPAKKHDYGHG